MAAATTIAPALKGLERINAILHQTALLRHFSEGELAEISQQAVMRRLSRDEPLVFEGEPSKGLFVLAEGSVRMFREGLDGREQVIRIEHAITTLNEIVLFDGGPHPFSISACEESLVLWLQFSNCRQKIRESPEFALDALEVMTGRLRAALDLVHSLSLFSVNQRLARFLLDQGRAYGTRCPDGIHLDLHMSNQQIGAVVGAVREVVSRSLSKLQKHGLISFQGRTIVIPDEAALETVITARREL